MASPFPPTRAQRLRPFHVTRNIMIVLGLLAGAGLGMWRYRFEFMPVEAPKVAAAKGGSPIQINAALPPRARMLKLNRPQSIDFPYGRELLTGKPALDAPRDPLNALPIDRSHDRAVPETPAAPVGELPAGPAADEVKERTEVEPPVIEYTELAALPKEAKELAEAAAKLLEEASRLQSAAKPGDDAYFKNQNDAAVLLKDARDKLYKALEIAPEAPELLDLMQEVKFALFIANKTGKK
ncbi:MAG: hypothetical protein IT462_07390 [Planctomycetes bacterium]|nr:hypothetical protein [Planctomycetota bacterium]